MRKCFDSGDLPRPPTPPPLAVLPMVLPVTAEFQQNETPLAGQRSGNIRGFQ